MDEGLLGLLDGLIGWIIGNMVLRILTGKALLATPYQWALTVDHVFTSMTNH